MAQNIKEGSDSYNSSLATPVPVCLSSTRADRNTVDVKA